MSVTGGARVAAALASLPDRLRPGLAEALRQGAVLVLSDMTALTPVDADEPGPHARDALTIAAAEDGLSVRVGLPSRELASDYFWFRFLDGGTKGGEVTARRRRPDGTVHRYTVRVPARPALMIRERALDQNIAEIRRLVADAVEEAIAAS